MWFVDRWCLRPGRRLLKVRVGDSLLERMYATSNNSYHALLERYLTQMGELEVRCVKRSTARIFDLQLSSLQTLRIRTGFDARIQSENLAMLHVLELGRTTAQIPTPLTSVTHFQFDFIIRPTPIIPQLPCLQHLAIGVSRRGGIYRGSESRLVLPPFISLEVQPQAPQNLNTARRLLASFSFPKLETIVLRGDFQSGEYQTIIRPIGL